MTQQKRKASDLTTEEVLKKLFPKKVADEAKKEAKVSPSAPRKSPGKTKDTP